MALLSPGCLCLHGSSGVCADVMVGMGYNLDEIQESLAKMKYDEITATYLLLGRKASEVQTLAASCRLLAASC